MQWCLMRSSSSKFAKSVTRDHNDKLEPTMSRSRHPLSDRAFCILRGRHQNLTSCQKLLEEDRIKHHCIYGGFIIISVISEQLSGDLCYPTQMSFRLLAVHDLGAPAKVLQAIYNKDVKNSSPNRHSGNKSAWALNENNWTNFLGQQKSAIVTVYIFY